MPSYRIPNQTAYTLPANASWWKGDADGLWTMNDQQKAEAGGEWPPAFIEPPDYADGYVTRFNQWLPMVANALSGSGFNAMICNAGAAPQANRYDAICWRCTTHDWTIEKVGVGNALNSGGTLAFQVAAWSGTTVNSGTPVFDSGNQSVNQGYNTSVTNNMFLPTAPSWGESTAVLSQNTWYTVGIRYTQSMGHQRGYYYHGNGYGYFYNTGLSGNLSATNNGGTTNLYGVNFESQGISGTAGSPWTGGSYSAYTHSSPLATLKVKVWQ